MIIHLRNSSSWNSKAVKALQVFSNMAAAATLSFLTIASVTSPPQITMTSWLSSDDYKWDSANPVPTVSNDAGNNVIDVSSSVSGMVLTCNASYPVEWTFHHEQLMFQRGGSRGRWLTTVSTLRKSGKLEDPYVYVADLRFVGDSSSITGNYTCQKVDDSSVSSSKYIYWEGSSPPFLIHAGQTRKVVVNLKSSDLVIIPCRVARPDITVSLLKYNDKQNSTNITEAAKWEEIKVNDATVKFDPIRGFILREQTNPLGKYKCAANSEPDKDFLIIQAISSTDDAAKPQEFKDIINRPASFNYDKEKKQFICCSKNGQAPKMMHFYCDHPTTCKLRKNSLLDMENAGKKLNDNPSCASIKIYVQTSGVIRCLGNGIDVIREYFFPMGFQFGFRSRRRGINNTSDDPYYSWGKANASKMIAVNAPPAHVYVGENYTFSCQASNFYFSRGIRWLVEWTNKTQLLIEEEVINGTSSIMGFQFFRRNINSLELPITLNLSSVTCMAPVWNTTEWKNKTNPVDVRVPTPPAIVGSIIEAWDWYVNETGKYLKCEATGDPAPTLSWKKNNMSTYGGLWSRNTILNITRVNHDTQGEYVCTAQNIGGIATKTFRIVVLAKTSTGAVVVAVLSVIGVLLCLISIGFLIQRLRKQKVVINHLAASAFKDVEQSQTQPVRGPAPDPLFSTVSSSAAERNTYENGAPAFDEGNYHKL